MPGSQIMSQRQLPIETHISDTLHAVALEFATVQFLDGGPQVSGGLELNKPSQSLAQTFVIQDEKNFTYPRPLESRPVSE